MLILIVQTSDRIQRSWKLIKYSCFYQVKVSDLSQLPFVIPGLKNFSPSKDEAYLNHHVEIEVCDALNA